MVKLLRLLLMLAISALIFLCFTTLYFRSNALNAEASLERHYYIGIDSVEWDYYPPSAENRENSRINQCFNSRFDKDQLLYVGNGEAVNTDGYIPISTYKKIIFREYTTNTFTKLKPRSDADEHLGVLGPTLRVSEGEALVITLRGLPSDEGNSLEANEFGFEIDGLFPSHHWPAIKPGEVQTHKYLVRKENAPTNDSYVGSHLLLYRGTIGNSLDASSGIYRGLIGGCIVYRAKDLLDSGFPRYVANELITIFWVENENKDESEKGQKWQSNILGNINGRIYCSLTGLKMTVREKTRWYFGAVGDKHDVHTAHIHGSVLTTSGGENTDSIRLIPGATASTEVIPDNIGTWFFHCHVDAHLYSGMAALVHIYPPNSLGESHVKSLSASKIIDDGTLRERKYYIQAEDVSWNYTPKGFNVCANRTFSTAEELFINPNTPIELDDGSTGYSIGSTVLKSRYVEYTDETFTTRKERDYPDDHLGIMGPVLRGRVGEVIVVHFRNNGIGPKSMHPHGLLYSKSNEGALYADGTFGCDKADDSILQGDTYIYRWVIPERSGPGPGEEQGSKLWIYHSHRNEIADSNSGLFGSILVVAKEGYHEETLKPTDGASEIFLHMSIMNEAKSYFFKQNVISVTGNEGKFEKLSKNKKFLKTLKKHSVNGYLFCNGPRPQINVNEPSHFYFSALGSVNDLHSPQVGNEILELGTKSSRGSATLLAGSFSSSIVIPRQSGTYEARCNVNMHHQAGMITKFDVIGQTEAKKQKPTITHYIAADKITWDYAMYGMDRCENELFGHHGRMFTEISEFSPGSRYVKAVYREYTDLSFQFKKGALEMNFSGISGPLLHFEVGDTVRIIFRNNLDFSVNLDMVGLNLVSGAKGSVEPDEIISYEYVVLEEEGPNENDPGPVARVYYSSVDAVGHTAAGLVGVYAVVKSGDIDKGTRRPVGFSKTYPLLLNIFKEYESPMIRESLNLFALNSTDADLTILMKNKMLKQKNTMHSANGFIYCNNPLLELPSGTKAIFYVFGFGSEMSIHNPVWKGQAIDSITKRGTNAKGVQILPFNAETTIVQFGAEGMWPIACSVAHHVEAGMKMRIDVTEQNY